MAEKTIYDRSVKGRRGIRFPEPDVPETALPTDLLRAELPLPEVSEIEVVRHFTKLSQLNHGVDIGFYPLGSCTMKYNPKVNEAAARLHGFSQVHPLQPVDTVQGALHLMCQLQDFLSEIGGFAGTTLQPAAGAHGELTGILIIKKYHEVNGQSHRNKILVPDSAHGTNPATSAMSGFVVKEIASDKRGNVDLEALKAECDETLAGFMLTNPNTLGLFDENVCEIAELVHEAGGLVYGDGANMNALLGIAKPGELGIDIMHYNLHKTFSTPHGGGGPGSGPVGVVESLLDFLPGPIVVMEKDDTGFDFPYYYYETPKHSIGRMKSFHGQFGVMARAFTYILMHGPDGLREVGEYAVLNANYLMHKLKDVYKLPFDRVCMHEFVIEGRWPEIEDIHALDISKRLMDFGFHPPTNYFPLIVREALMIEPTETESKETLDAFAAAMLQIAEEAKTNPELLHSAPHTTPIGRLDEVHAAKNLILCCGLPKDLD
jgi:glycine dehydrogenase subunit 2